jgi:hypothetical protein
MYPPPPSGVASRPAVPPGGTNNFQKNEEMFYSEALLILKIEILIINCESHVSCSADFHVAEYAILSYTRNSGFWLDNWRSACPERLFLLPKSRYFMKAEVVNIQTFLTKLSARVYSQL